MRRIRNSVDIDEQEVGRWLISYADFITLLFAFFVVLYSISQVSASKYKILAQSLEGAFETPLKSPDPIQIGELSRSLQPVTGDDIERPELESDSQESGNIDSENFASTESFKDLEQGLQASLGDLVDQDLAEINSDANWINIVLKSALLFPSGSDQLNNESEPLMEELVKHLNTNRQLILVHGHTDNIPINTSKFPSNWELSSARGVAVVRKLQKLNVQPNRLSVEGHGEYQPISDNVTVEGRRENRRVVIAISRQQQVAALAPETGGTAVNTEVSDELLGVDNSDVDSLDTADNGIDTNQKVVQKEEELKYEIIKLPGGGILIRGKELPPKDKSRDSTGQNDAENEQ